MVLRALIPLGFMPDLTTFSDGRFEIIICQGHGQATITVDSEGNPIPSKTNQKSPFGETLCPVAAAAAVALVAFALFLLWPWRWLGHPYRLTAIPCLEPLAGFGPAPARAPPAS